jgi:crotonobetainyl-CoA:carnitine CoA-transferase CaiB-like acyl-CoA transferase
MPKILEDIRVLDLTHVWFGPFCTMMLAELGAEVIKIEPPWGTIGRLGPGPLYKRTSSTFYALNLNKRDLSIDLKTPEGGAIFRELVKKSDIVIQNFVPGTMERLGFGYNTLKELRPDIIYAALSGFGQTGPYSRLPSYAAIAEAFSGHTYGTGKNHDPEGPPISMAGALGDLGPAIYAAFSIVAAIRHRDRTGQGQMIDVNQIDSMIAFNTCESVTYDLFGETWRDIRCKTPPDPNRIWGIFRVKDGWVQIAGERPKAIEKLKQRLGVEEINDQLVAEAISGMTRMEAFRYMTEVGMPVAPIYDSYEAMDDPHIEERGMKREVVHPTAGRYTVPNFPVKFSETPGEVKTAAPMLGQDTEEILTTLLGFTEEEVAALEKEGKIVCWRG